MTLCPMALIVGCKKCPMFAICPLKKLIGDYSYRKRKKTQTSQDIKENPEQGEQK
jgi:hypothetical protein